MTAVFRLIALAGAALLLLGAGTDTSVSVEALSQNISDAFNGRKPKEWGEKVTGVRSRLNHTGKVLALTLDACGSSGGKGFDSRLIDFLVQNRVPATLFMNARWIEANRELFRRLAGEPLFEIANHGTWHKPASVSGRSVYGIKGTADAAELAEEIERNARKIEEITGRRPRWYRSGTAYYDEVAVEISGRLGHEVAGFSVLGDAGATYPAEKVKKALLASAPGDIIILHMNHPESGTAEGATAAIKELVRQGFSFVKLSDSHSR